MGHASGCPPTAQKKPLENFTWSQLEANFEVFYPERENKLMHLRLFEYDLAQAVACETFM